MEPEQERPRDDAIRAQLQRILDSRTFARSERQKRFLNHVVDAALEDRPEALTESVLGTAVCDRGRRFDPKADNIVRVDARRLRQRLENYYAGEGSGDEVLIELPTGGYVPRFSGRKRRDESRRGKLRVRATWAFVCIVALAVAGRMVWQRSSGPVAMAVLPFADFSPGGEDRYLAEGFADDLIQAFSENPRLRVAARASAFQFRGDRTGAAEIGRRLGVKVLLEGSLRRRGTQFDIAARLIEAGSGNQIWSGTEQVAGVDVRAGEMAIVAGASKALGIGSPARISRHVPPAEARELMLQARFLDARGGAANRARAVELYRKAVLADPNYGQGSGEMARAMSLTVFQDWRAGAEFAPRVREAAGRAIGLEGRSSNASLALARIAWIRDWNWAAAEREFRRALEIDPSSSAAHQSYALGLMSRRHFEEAVLHSSRAAELDPLSFEASNDLGAVWYAARRWKEAEAQVRRSLSLTPKAGGALFLEGTVRAAQGRFGDAITSLEAAAAEWRRAPEVLGRLGNAYARAGRVREAQAVLSELANAEAIYQAMIETGLGHTEAALAGLRRSAERREPDFVFLAVDAIYDPLRREPEFAQLCGRLGLPAR